ncbi:M1 family peptidase [Rugamonas sp. FT107W]|uniref:Aminopeptidase n=1 Tax=Duganella vulcania TaxID=2692166 RepID=A0A845HTY8_9BURK|nr:M1 family metallopeptidase [Duganella vulcania]MYN20955.1 M1 family peptidase [Duganella vulcania]
MRARGVMGLALALAFPAAPVLAQAAPPVFDFATTPGRLPKNVVPLEYTIALTPDAASHTVAGTESIVLDFKAASAVIQFNSLNQKLSKVLLDGKPVRSVVSDDKAQLTTIKLARPAGPGRHTLSFAYAGKIEKEPRGLFLQEYVTPAGARDAMLTTQFEATDARRMFPCWDEPAFRAVFKLSVTVPAKWAVYSNMPESERSVKGALATTRFAPTPKMPTYLVEFSGGDLAHIAAESGGTQFRVVAVRGQEQGGQQALANAQQILADYNDYFGVRYPLPKLDSIAVPGGFSGAMENWGAITYNDQALLITPSSTMGNRQGVYSTQAHEMAHQWFGDLVTMGWWDELWLNESFASWMAARQTDLRNPSWRWWEHQDATKEDAMGADARATSHAIVQHVTNELQASSAFDPAITYSKGQAVLRMLEAHMGADNFRSGIRSYMKTHAYSNTLSGDLWQALDGAGAGQVSGIARAWTSQPGFPLVSVTASCDAAGERTIALTQQRFLLQGLGGGKGHWPVPLQVRSGTGAPKPVLFDGDRQSVPAGRCDEALSINAGALGYFRTAYDDATLARITQSFASVPEADRIALLDDQWALVAAGAQPLASYLALASAMGDTANQRAWEQITGALDTIETAERGTAGHAAFAAYARSIVKPLSVKLGWDARADESPGMQKLRRSLLADLGGWGDPDVLAEARKRFAAFAADRAAISADDQLMVLAIVARHATAAEFEQLHAIAKSARNETELRRYYTALMQVRDPALAEKAAAIALSDEIPKQADMARIGLVGVLGGEHPQLSWSVFTQNSERLIAPHQPFGPMILAQYTPEMFWRALPPEQLEAWIKGKVPADLLPNLARGMEVARFKLAEKAMLVKATDAYLAGKQARAD